MKILFVASWFPSRVHATDGNFVEKHARIVARQHDLLVIHAQYDPALAVGEIDIKTESQAGYIVWIAYFGLSPNAHLWQKFLIRRRAYHALWQKMKMQWGLPEAIHAHILFDAGVFAAYWSQKNRIPFILTEHASLYHNGTHLAWYHRVLASWVGRRARYILPVSHHLAKAMQTIGIKAQWRVLPNSVNTQLFQFSEPPTHPPFRFLHISNFVAPAKNTEGIIRAFAQMTQQDSNVQLTIAGDGNLEPLRQLSRTLNLKSTHLHFLGEQSEKEVARLMQSHHVFVLFSNYENLPVVLLEAQCCGLPIIATAVGGIPEIVSHAGQGLLIPPADEAALLSALRQMRNQYHTYDRPTIAQQAQRKYSEQQVLAQLESIYFELVRDGF